MHPLVVGLKHDRPEDECDLTPTVAAVPWELLIYTANVINTKGCDECFFAGAGRNDRLWDVVAHCVATVKPDATAQARLEATSRIAIAIWNGGSSRRYAADC